MKLNKGLMQTKTGQKLAVLLAVAILTTEAPADPAPADPPTDPAPADPALADPSPTAPDLATLFTPEEIEARQTEATRRAALTDEQRTAEDQAKAEEAAKNAPPEEYAEFAINAEGVVLDPEMINEFKPLAKEFGLNQDKAQKLVDLAVKVQQRTMDGIFAMHEERKATWLKEAEADPEIGEDIKKGAESATLRAFNTVAGSLPDVKAMVDELGIGNHPAFLRVFYQLSKRIREDSFEGAGSGGEAKPAALANRMYPNMK